MTWWCVATERPWDWTPRPYLGVWLLCAGLIAAYVIAWRRHGGRPTRRQGWQFAGGVAALWVASDWPVGALGGGYLSSVHMLQFMLYTLAAAPLLMLSTPEWMAAAVLGRLRLGKLWAWCTRPVAAALITNAVLLATHNPFSVDLFRSSQAGSFLLDMIWLVGGTIMWAPIINPIRSLRPGSALVKIVYLFCAAALIPMIPGGFIAFSPHPLYVTYELAPRVGIAALADQQFAGVLMKIGNVPVIWAVMGVIWFRWYEAERRSDEARRKAKGPARGPVRAAPVATSAEPIRHDGRI